MPKWTRLIRFRDAKGVVKYGEPILLEGQEHRLDQLADAGKLEVKVCEGITALDAIPGSNVEVVSKLLGPLTPAEVPIIRCIGLNYKTHSTQVVHSAFN